MSKHEKKTSSLLHYPVLVCQPVFHRAVRAGYGHPGPQLQRAGKYHPEPAPGADPVHAKGLNSYFTAYTKYVKDQVAGRDQWISLQSVVETTLLQKQQNGGILLGKEHMMFPRTYGLLSSEERTLTQKHRSAYQPVPALPGQGECAAGTRRQRYLQGERARKRSFAGRGRLP